MLILLCSQLAPELRGFERAGKKKTRKRKIDRKKLSPFPRRTSRQFPRRRSAFFRMMFKRASSAAWSVESRPRALRRDARGAREAPVVRRCTTRHSAAAAAHRRRRASGAEAPPLERRSHSRSAASSALACGCLCESPSLSLTVCVLWRASGRSEPRFVSVGVWLRLSVAVSQYIKSAFQKQHTEASRASHSYSRPHHMGWRQHLRRLIKHKRRQRGL